MGYLASGNSCVSYRYEVKDFYFTVKDSRTRMKGYELKSLMIINDYIENIFPIVQLKVSMDYETYYEIIRNKDNVKIRINIQKYYTKVSDVEKSLKSQYLNTTFTLILDDDDEDLYTDIRKKNNVEGDDSTSLYDQDNEVEFYLFKSSLVKASKKKINKILKNCNVTNAVALVMDKMGIDNLLMSRSPNDTEYSEIIIPPLKATQAISYIDTFYGLYPTGSMLFFGVDRSYLIKYDGRCTAYESGEITSTTIIVPKVGTEASQNVGSILGDGGYTIIADYETIEFQNQSVTKNILNGEHLQIDNAESSEIDGTMNRSGINKKIIKNRGKNKYFKSTYTRMRESLEHVIIAQFSDIDLSSLAPNKSYHFVFEDSALQKKYSGTYVLVKSEIALIRKESHLSAVAKCEFRVG